MVLWRDGHLNFTYSEEYQVPIPMAERSKADRFLGVLFRIPPALWMSVSCECSVLSGRGLCEGRSLVQRSHADSAVSELM